MDNVLSQMLERNSYEAISGILNGITLAPFQSIDLLTALYVRKALIRYDTGMGKTFIAAGIMKCIHRLNKNSKTIMFVKNHQLIQTPEDIRKATGLKVITTDATANSITNFIRNRNFTMYDVLILTHECLNDRILMQTLFMEREAIGCIIVDEMHELTNYDSSNSAMMLKAMVKNYNYVYGLTATPLASNIEQLIKMLRIINYHLIDSVYGTKKALLSFAKNNAYENLENSSEGVTTRDITEFFPGSVISRSRRSIGIVSNYIAKAHIVKPTPYQRDSYGADMFVRTRGEGAYPQSQEVINIINSHKPGKGLIFVWRHEIREFLIGELEKAGIRCACINGNTSIKERKRIQNNFQNGDYDVVITSVTSSLNFDSEFVIFYEFTLDYDQMTGRAERGLNPKTLYVHYIFTENTGEASFFKKYIYDRAFLTTSLLGVSTKGVLDVYEQIEHLLPEDER